MVNRSPARRKRLLRQAAPEWYLNRASGEMWLWTEPAREVQGFSAGDPLEGPTKAVLLAAPYWPLHLARCSPPVLPPRPSMRAERLFRMNGWIETERSAKGEIVFQRRIGEAS
jgi:hypothetical protein